MRDEPEAKWTPSPSMLTWEDWVSLEPGIFLSEEKSGRMRVVLPGENSTMPVKLIQEGGCLTAESYPGNPTAP